jgi:uncharacterized membrane protein YbhN (UPF0104 family)
MAEVQRSRSWQGRAPYLLSLTISGLLVVVGIAIMYHRIDWRSVAAVWTNLNPLLVAAAAVLYWLQYPIAAWRMQQVILWTTGRSSAQAPPLRFLFRLTCSASFVAVAAPVGLAGDAAKIAALRLFGDLSITDATRCALFDRVVGVQCIGIIGLATLPFQAAGGIDTRIVLTQLVVFGGLLAGVAMLLVFPRFLAMTRHALVERVARVFAGYRSLIELRRLAIQLAISSITILLASGSLYLLLRAADLDTGIWVVVAFIPLLQLVNGLPFLYMGWGGRELAMAATLGVAGKLGVNETLAISIAFGLILIVAGAVNGIFLLGDWQRSGRFSSGDGRADPGAVQDH